ncbi:TSSP-like protein [Mya arenaria]|uniref:TSSP-like protein n=1 Tax=Mya arenaria TaxID=6604 RepID=A0ABY7EP05_MYAAR|nr:TSSP-like protein [Mya arenaria]
MKFGCTFCVLLSVVCVSYVIEAIKGNRFWKIRERVEEHRRKHADAVIAARHRSSPVKTFFIEQPLDHFNAISKGLGKTYKQRYYVNAEFWFGNKSPVFLFIGGEGTLTSRDVEIGEIEDQVQFVTNLAGNIMGVVQYNNEIPGQNISHVCDVMLSASNPYSNLIKLNKEMLLESNETCVDNCFMNYTRTMNQTCDKNTSCPFSKLMSLDFSDLQICQKVFKINEEDVFSNVQFSNDYYGANHTAQSNIVFVNGNIDPWHYLSILADQEMYRNVAVFIDGTAHCADLGSSKPTDPESLTDARMAIARYVTQFLDLAYASVSMH